MQKRQEVVRSLLSACPEVALGLTWRWILRSRTTSTPNIARFSAPTAASQLHHQPPITMNPTLVVLAFISLAGLAIIVFGRFVPARASSNSGIEPVQARTSEDRYNSLLKNAKTALIAGDRATTVDLLEQAKHMILTCPALQDGASPETVLLSLSTRDGMRVREPMSPATGLHAAS